MTWGCKTTRRRSRPRCESTLYASGKLQRPHPGISLRALQGFPLAWICPGGETGDMARAPIITETPMSAEVRPGRHGLRTWKVRGTQRLRAVCDAPGRLAGLALLFFCAGCAVPSITVESAELTARPNPSPDGSYAVQWTPIAGASAYRLFEDGALSYQGSSLSHAYAGKAAGSYTYSLTYCVTALGVEICDLRPGLHDLTVTVSE